jgi:hypothetical protein
MDSLLDNALDFANAVVYLVRKQLEVRHARLLYEMPNDEGDERNEGHNHEERQARDSRGLPSVWNQDVQNWQGLKPCYL